MALSGGQKQRLSIACALLSDRRRAPARRADERAWTSTAWWRSARLVQGASPNDGACIVLVTHDLEFLNRCCDDVLELACAQGGNGGAHG